MITTSPMITYTAPESNDFNIRMVKDANDARQVAYEYKANPPKVRTFLYDGLVIYYQADGNGVVTVPAIMSNFITKEFHLNRFTINPTFNKTVGISVNLQNVIEFTY